MVFQELVSTLAQEKGPDQEQLIKMTNVIISQPCLTNGLGMLWLQFEFLSLSHIMT